MGFKQAAPLSSPPPHTTLLHLSHNACRTHRCGHSLQAASCFGQCAKSSASCPSMREHLQSHRAGLTFVAGSPGGTRGSPYAAAARRTRAGRGWGGHCWAASSPSLPSPP